MANEQVRKSLIYRGNGGNGGGSRDCNPATEVELVFDNATHCVSNSTTVLDLSNQTPELEGPIPPEIANLSQLTDLRLNGNALSGPIPPEIGDIDPLRHLRLHYNQLTGEIPVEILKQRTENLVLGFNQLSGPIPPEIGILGLAYGYDLIELNLRNNQLEALVPETICDLFENNNNPTIKLENNQLCAFYPVCLENSEIGQQDTSNCLDVCEELGGITLWDVCYDPDTTTEIIRPYEGLTGQIPPAIGSFVNLDKLDLSNNELTGNIPAGIGNFQQMEDYPSQILLNNNNLSGLIPDSVCDLSEDLLDHAQTFNLAHNNLCPPYPACLTDVISNNQFENQNPTNCETCEELGGVTIFGECFDVNEDKIILSNRALTNYSEDSAFSPDLLQLQKLESLDLYNNNFTGNIPHWIGQMSSLMNLRINNNQFSGIQDPQICNAGWDYNGDTYDELEVKTNNNQLCPPYPDCFTGNSYQDTTGCDPAWCLENPHTDYVYLWGTCYNIETTTELNLNNSGLTGEIPPEIGNLTNVTYLNLTSNQLTGDIPSEIGNLTNLTELRLYNNQLTGEIPVEIGNLTTLTYLSLGFNQLTGEIPTEIGNLTNLTYLRLSSNQLTGIPPEIGNLMNLTELYLYNNELTGEIPSSIGNLTNLTILYLRNNQLTGEIPPEIGNLTNLINLQLNGNNLTLLPESICSIPGILKSDGTLETNQNVLNLGYNEFCPPYPTCLLQMATYGWTVLSTQQPFPECGGNLVWGCMDNWSDLICNYNPDVNIPCAPDGSHQEQYDDCEPEQRCNFGQTVGWNLCWTDTDNDGDYETELSVYLDCDETCETHGYSTVPTATMGCTDPTACNFPEIEVEIDDGSCYYALGWTTCCNDTDGDGIYEEALSIYLECDETCEDNGYSSDLSECAPVDWDDPTTGCTDPEASNYDIVAYVFDGTCEYDDIPSVCDPFLLYLVVDTTGSMGTLGLEKALEILQWYNAFDRVCGFGVVAQGADQGGRNCVTEILTFEDAEYLLSATNMTEFADRCEDVGVVSETPDNGGSRTVYSLTPHIHTAYQYLMSEAPAEGSAEQCFDTEEPLGKIIYIVTDDDGIGQGCNYPEPHGDYGDYEVGEGYFCQEYDDDELYPCYEYEVADFRQILIDNDIRIYFNLQAQGNSLCHNSNFDYSTTIFHFNAHRNFIYNDPPQMDEEACSFGCTDPLAQNYNPAASSPCNAENSNHPQCIEASTPDDGDSESTSDNCCCEYAEPDCEYIFFCCEPDYLDCSFTCSCKETQITVWSWSTEGLLCEQPNICCQDMLPPPAGNNNCDNGPWDWVIQCADCSTIGDGEIFDWMDALPEHSWDNVTCEDYNLYTCPDGTCVENELECFGDEDDEDEDDDEFNPLGQLIGYVYRKTGNPYTFKGPYPECNSTYPRWDLDNDDEDDFYTSWYRHGYSNDNPIWNEYDEEMPELTCAAVFGLECGNHHNPPYSGDSAHGDNSDIWTNWWSRSSNPNDYIAVECSSNEDGIYYQCHERLEYTEPEYIQCFRCLSNTDCEPNEICNFDAESATEDYGCCEVPLFGDVNLDNRVNIQDIILLVDYILGFVDNLTEYQIALADVNQDGIININDVTQLINSILNNRTLENNRRELQRQLDRLSSEPNEKQKLIDEILRKQKNG